MSILDVFGSVAKVVVRTVILPVAIVSDIAKGFDPYDNSESDTLNNLSESADNLKHLPEVLDE
jgi:hypothetical protein